nr:beta-propeller fold lactonase family protein [Coralloluteibacterium stylophorae]
MTLAPDGARLYVADAEGNAIVVVDTATRAVVGRIEGDRFPDADDGCPDNICRGQGASDIAIAADGRRAVASSMTKDAVSVLDLEQGTVTARVPVGRFPRALAITADGRRAWVVNAVADTVSEIDVDAAQAVGEPIAIGDGDASRQPFGRMVGLWLSPDERALFVYDAFGDAIAAFDTGTRARREAAAIDAELGGLALAHDGRRVALQDHAALAVHATGTDLDTLHSVPTCAPGGLPPTRLALASDGRHVAVAHMWGQRIHLVDVATGRTVASYGQHDGIAALAFAPDDGTLYALGFDGSLAFIDPSRSAGPPETPLFCPAPAA